MSQLPQGWTEVAVRDVSRDINYGYTTSASTVPIGPKFLRITDIQNGKVDWNSVPYCKESPTDIADYQLKRGDIVFARTGATTGKSFLIRSAPTAVFASYLIRLRPSSEVWPQFLARFFQSRSYWEQISDNISGSAQPNCNATKLASISIPLPPLNEQRRIVAKLEKLLSRVDAAQARLAIIRDILKRFRQSVLAGACSGKLTADWREINHCVESARDLLCRINLERKSSSFNLRKTVTNPNRSEPFNVPETWSFCRFDDIAGIKPNALKAGPFGSSLTKSCYVSAGYKIYGQEQVIRGDASYGDYYIDEAKFRELQSCEVEAGDILISLVGTIGKVLIVPKTYEKGIINPRLVKISLHRSVVNSWIEKYLTSPIARNILDQDSHGGTMEILNLGMLKKLPIPLPPTEEQQEIVRRIEALFKTADALEARYRKAKAHVDKLTQSILTKAFRGELVPQDPNDEPAGVLVERLRRSAINSNCGKHEKNRRVGRQRTGSSQRKA